VTQGEGPEFKPQYHIKKKNFPYDLSQKRENINMNADMNVCVLANVHKGIFDKNELESKTV
jgi:hypothetical protein